MTKQPLPLSTDKRPLTVIAGPCQIESFEHCCSIAEFLLELAEKNSFTLVFKSSFDKANRTSLGSKRGPGISEGLDILSKVREKYGVPVTSDIHPHLVECIGCLLAPSDGLAWWSFACRDSRGRVCVPHNIFRVSLHFTCFQERGDYTHSWHGTYIHLTN